MEVAVIGNDDFVIGFQLAGVQQIYVATNPEEVEQYIHKVVENQNTGIMVLEEEDVGRMSNRMKKQLDRLITPVVVTLSSKGKETDLRELIKRTVGVDLWK